MTKCIKGSINADEHYPQLEFSICKDIHDLPGKRMSFIGIIDTGFTGFIQLPRSQVLKLGLTADKSTTARVADGSQRTVPLAEAVAFLNGDPISGLVWVSQLNYVLLGMDFLRKIDKALIVSKNAVYLIDEDYIRKNWISP